MHKYKNILVLHPFDKTTAFLEPFGTHFKEYYFPFTSEAISIHQAKERLGDIEEKSLIIFVGHGSSMGLYTPDDSEVYDNYFIDATWGNNYFDGHDILLLSCKSREFIDRLYKYSESIGFGNIISSPEEQKLHNSNSEFKKNLSNKDIDCFNNYYISAIIDTLKLLVDGSINFRDVSDYICFFINKKINLILKDKTNANRIELARVLFEFRNELRYKRS